jgi:hypothetical protein
VNDQTTKTEVRKSLDHTLGLLGPVAFKRVLHLSQSDLQILSAFAEWLAEDLNEWAKD